jgi:diguanylate cyclase (GGDEF)-like protein
MSEWDEETGVGGGAGHEMPGGRDRAYLIVLSGLNVGEMFQVGAKDLLVGRGQECQVQVADDGVSRRHATLRTVADEIWLEDSESRNGTFVNGERVAGRHRLVDGDKIQIGAATVLKFTFSDDLDETFQRRMYESALRDPLTKAFNKRYLLDRLESEFRFARRHKVPLSLVLMDLDNFKAVNDRHGHVVGDQVLVAFARKIHDIIRNEDVFARYGGEEFAILCRQIEIEKATAFAERLRRNVEQMEILVAGEVLKITMSVGVAALPQAEVTESLALIAAADQALYAAKNAGRNRVMTTPHR